MKPSASLPPEVLDHFSALPLTAPENLRLFSEMLDTTARRAGLIGPNEDPTDHIVRGLLVWDALPASSTVIDVGSGAGLPGIVLGIAGKRVVMVEPKRRAVAFLEKAIRELGAVEMSVVERRAQDVLPELAEWADCVTARALAAPDAALELCAPLCRVGGVVCLTSSSAKGAPTANQALGTGQAERRTLAGPLAISQEVLMIPKISSAPLS